MKVRFIFFITLFSILFSCEDDRADYIPVKGPGGIPYAWDQFSMGVDLSYVNEIEDYGGIYRESGKAGDPFLILKKHGANTVRVRLWHNPAWVGNLTGGRIYSDLKDVEKTIQRAKDAGMAVSLDLHYSDTWADPAHQETPAAWAGLDLPVLKDSVYRYTLNVLNYLKSRNLTPEMIQLGNEINGGMLFPRGKVVSDNWTAFGELLNAAIKAVRDFSGNSGIKPRIILHVAQFQHAGWWINGVINKAKVTDFDIIGVSHYAKWSTYNSMEAITTVIRDIRTKYDKEVMVVETAYPWTTSDADNYPNIMGKGDSVQGYSLSPDGQKKYFADLTQAIISGGGCGIQYWEPGWITSPMPDLWGTGSPWDNCTLFDHNGDVLPASDFMRAVY